MIKPGDTFIYSFDDTKDNKTCCFVEVLEILDDPRGVARVKFLHVLCDDSGNGILTYLWQHNEPMNVSIKYLTPMSAKIYFFSLITFFASMLKNALEIESEAEVPQDQ